ncbi:MAG: type II toxin-antitoxin system RelE/ParE family toxin [Bacteroidia bacterium]
MVIDYKNNRLRKSVSTLKEIAKNYGNNAKKVNQRIQELTSATTLEDIRPLPGPKCHELTGEYEGSLAVSVSPNHRIIFEPANDPIPTSIDGGLDWAQVTEILITAINIDYH